MRSIFIKRGEPLILDVTFTDSEGIEMDLDLTDIKSEVRDCYGNLLGIFEINRLEETKYRLKLKDTLNYPLGQSYLDIRVTCDEGYVYSETITLNMLENITRGN